MDPHRGRARSSTTLTVAPSSLSAQRPGTSLGGCLDPDGPTPGMAGLGKGRTGTFTTNLTPGKYGLICYIPDAKDGKPHSMHGMVQELTVAAK